MVYSGLRLTGYLVLACGVFPTGLATFIDGVRVAREQQKEKDQEPHPLGPIKSRVRGSSDWEYKKSLIQSITEVGVAQDRTGR